MVRPGARGSILAGLAVGGVVALVWRGRRVLSGRRAPGGIVMGDAGAYDTLSRLLLGSLFRSIAADIAAGTQPGAKVLEIGCGPGHLSDRLARAHLLEVTGLDLDPAMIARARARTERTPGGMGRSPSFIVGDVASLPFDDGAVDIVVSTFSMHHWTDRSAGLGEIARVLRPGGRALVWDFKAGGMPFHAHAHDPADRALGTPLRVDSVRTWRWPWHLAIAERIEFTNAP